MTNDTDTLRGRLLALVEETRLSGVSRLPSLDSLVSRTGVSRRSLWKALLKLRLDGVIRSRPGSGYFLPEAAPAAPAAPAGPKWRRVHDAIARDLHNRAVAPEGHLPSTKELCLRYGANYRTLEKALAALHGSGTLTPRPGGWRVADLAPARSSGSLLLLAAGDRHGALEFVSGRPATYLQLLEAECARAGVGLRLATFDSAGGAVHEPHAGADPLVLGVLAWEQAGKPVVLRSLTAHLAGLNKPCALLSEDPDPGLLPPRSGLVRLFALEPSHSAGDRMGSYVAALGHRRVAYISPLHASRWSVERLAGVAAASTRTGAVVVPFVLSEYRYAYESMDRVARNAMARWLRGVFRDAARGTPDRDPRLLATLRDLGSQVAPRLQSAAFRHMCRPLYAAAAADTAVTAWVCANDEVAAEAVTYLRAAGRRVPQEISVAGFDDSAAAFERRITSYNFNAAAAVHAMLRHALGPSSPLLRSRDRLCSVDGFVVQRQSTARAPSESSQLRPPPA